MIEEMNRLSTEREEIEALARENLVDIELWFQEDFEEVQEDHECEIKDLKLSNENQFNEVSTAYQRLLKELNTLKTKNASKEHDQNAED